MLTESIADTLQQRALYVGAGAGVLITFIKPVHKALDTLGKNLKIGKAALAIPAIIGAAASFLTVPPIISWSVSKEVQASRMGRYEALKKDLSSLNQFAILSDEQQKEVEQKTKDVVLSKQEKKKITKGNLTGIKGMFKGLKEIFIKDKDYLAQREEYNKQIESDRQKFDKVKLDEKNIENAKKDKQLIGNIIEKIDTASQDYAEDLEFATNFISSFCGICSAGLAFLLKKALPEKFKAAGMASSIFVGFVPTVAFSAIALKLQKQGSRVARFKVKQDFMNNPEKVIYFDDEKAKDVKDYQIVPEKKRNIFKFIKQARKDNKEYNAYMKEHELEDKKKRKALDSIQLSEDQKKDAKALQKNVFKIFNEVDEKSQQYSEKVEALGNVIKSCGSMIAGIAGLAVGAIWSKKSLQSLFSDITSKKRLKLALKVLQSYLQALLLQLFLLPFLIGLLQETRKKPQKLLICSLLKK